MFQWLRLFIFLIPFALSLGSPDQNALIGSFSLVTLLIFLALWTLIKGLSLEKLAVVKYPLLLFVFSLMIAVIFSANQTRSFVEIPKYSAGLLLFLTVASLPEKEKRQLVPAIALTALSISFLAIYQYFFGFEHLQDYVIKAKITDPFILETVAQKRVFFPFMTPNILGGYLAMVLPLIFYSKKWILLALPILFAIFLTRSLSTLLSLAVVFAAFFLFQTHSRKKRALILLVFCIIIGYVFALRAANPKQHLLPAFSVMTRFHYWKDTWEIIRTNPLTGIGLGNFALPTSYYAHNSHLQLWAEAGLVCIISFFWLVATVVKSILKKGPGSFDKKWDSGLLAGVCIFLVHNFMDFSFFLPAVSLIWWVMLGLLYSPKPEKV